MDGNRSSILPIIGAILIIIAMGVGGYFLGKYLDVLELNKKAADNNTASLETKNFQSTALGISFKYPSNWTVVENTSSDIKTIKASNTNGSQFVYTKDTTVTKPTEFFCNLADRNGSEEGTESCEFFSGKNINFARYEDLAKNADGSVLNVAEQGLDKNSNWYKYVPSDGFTFSVKGDDIALLDGIMMSVARTTSE